ncbi:GNAT family N-acetyltransferase [Streptomyces triticirhizae]|uniref:GNAT family N-acetyltransferase n=1 Tax=Streptomyces triticirhizae TaxID=2483353 RepID=UPI001F2C79E2|nr:GNAT family N-acetyltransferase [Streptomyces triticirhizae]
MTGAATGAELSTERLLLRPWTDTELAAVGGDLRAPNWAGDFPADGDRVIAGLLAEQAPAVHPLGHRLIVERATGLVVGSIGFGWPPLDGVVEFGYGVVPSRRGHGVATEAARALVAFALAAPGVREVRASAELTNPASLRVLLKAGLRRTGDDGTVAHFSTARPAHAAG